MIAYVDDDPSKRGLNIHGAKVLETKQEVQTPAVQHHVDTIMVAMDKVSGEDIQEIVGCVRRPLGEDQKAPDLFSFMEGSEGQSLVRDVRREGKVVLVA